MSVTTTSGVSTNFRRLALITVIMIYILINVGGIVRVTHSGLGCPDWPLCYGQVVPLEGSGITTAIEFSHRLVAGITGLFMIGLAVAAWREYRHNRRLIWFSTLAIIILPFQITLGGIVVYTELAPLTVLIHLGTALLIFAFEIVVLVEAYRPQGLPGERLPPRFLPLLWATTFGIFILVVFGALVVGTGGSLACPDWPLCNGEVLPLVRMQAAATVFLHATHRYIAAAIGLLLLGLVWYSQRNRAQMPGMARWSWALLLAFAAQIIIGGVKILSGEATVMRALHLGAAAAVWAVLIVMLVLAHFRAQAQAAPESTATADEHPRAQPAPGK